MRNKVIPVVLPPDAYKRLEREAKENDRDIHQQARFILKRALEDPERQPVPAR
jgi:hypothetical protein